ncbi:MAG TPA: hypothetical protein VMU87_13340 [Stellaceae bacterium]|nr:hypothetical protein [Stellaceae bacterium]
MNGAAQGFGDLAGNEQLADLSAADFRRQANSSMIFVNLVDNINRSRCRAQEGGGID